MNLREAAQQALEALEMLSIRLLARLLDIETVASALEQPVQPLCDIAEDGVCETLDCCGNPPRREWQGLTEEEIRDLWSWSATAEAERTATTQQHAFARAIEKALKEKNDG
jgi:hypothetical protein